MWCEINRVVQVIAVLLSVFCVHGLNASAVIVTTPPSSLSSSLLKQVEESVLPAEPPNAAQQLAKHNFLFGIISLGAFHENNTQCGRELEIMSKAMATNEVWGLKVLDYFGVPPNAFTWGNYFWFSKPDLCDALNQPYAITLSESKPLIINATSPFPVKFVIVYFNFTTPYYIDVKLPFDSLIHVGLCVPQTCSNSKIKSHTDAYFQQEYFEMQRNFKLKMKALDAKAPHFSWKFFLKPGSIMFLYVFFNESVRHYILRYTVLRLYILIFLTSATTTTVSIHSNKNNNNNNNIKNNNTVGKCDSKKSSIWQELLLCFRFSLNYKTAITLENSNSNFITVMAGLRTIICLWITVFHVYYYSLFALSNVLMVFAKLEYFLLQPILQACFYVDVFFIISSFLLVNNFLSNRKLIDHIERLSWWGNVKLFARSVLQRYMRLTPVMIITMLLGTMIVDLLNMISPFRLVENSGLNCKNNWWYNLLYIQNMLDMNYICCSWTWYLACEMQYFILFTGLLFVHVKKPIAAKIAFVTLALGFVVVGWMCYFARGITFELDVVNSTLNQLYIKPWTRIPPYFGGATMGWLMHKLQLQRQQTHTQHTQQRQQQQEQLKMQLPAQQHQVEQHESTTTADTHHPQHQHGNHQTQQHHHHHHQHLQEQVRTFCGKIFWIFCLVLYVTTNFMSYWHSTPTWVVATIMSIGKLLFALCIGGLIIMCAWGRGGRFNVLMSARPFLILNKFSYSIYMVAPVVVVAMFGLRNEPTNFTDVGSGADFLAIIILSITSAFVMLMLIELPIQRIANLLMEQKKI